MECKLYGGMKTVFLELLTEKTPQGERCVGRCWEENPHDAVTLEQERLGPQDPVAISDPKPPHISRNYPLGQLVQAEGVVRGGVVKAPLMPLAVDSVCSYQLAKYLKPAAVDAVDSLIIPDLARVVWPREMAAGHGIPGITPRSRLREFACIKQNNFIIRVHFGQTASAGEPGKTGPDNRPAASQ